MLKGKLLEIKSVIEKVMVDENIINLRKRRSNQDFIIDLQILLEGEQNNLLRFEANNCKERPTVNNQFILKGHYEEDTNNIVAHVEVNQKGSLLQYEIHINKDIDKNDKYEILNIEKHHIG